MPNLGLERIATHLFSWYVDLGLVSHKNIYHMGAAKGYSSLITSVSESIQHGMQKDQEWA